MIKKLLVACASVLTIAATPAGATTFFYDGKIDIFYAPQTGLYDIVAAGAQGGAGDGSNDNSGAQLGGRVSLTAGSDTDPPHSLTGFWGVDYTEPPRRPDWGAYICAVKDVRCATSGGLSPRLFSFLLLRSTSICLERTISLDTRNEAAGAEAVIGRETKLPMFA